MTDITERVEAALATDREHCGWRPLAVELLAELKAARAQIEELQGDLAIVESQLE